jgi:integrase
LDYFLDLADVANYVASIPPALMASLRKKDRCCFWYACFTLPDGRRVQRSTRETKRKPAQAKADQWEALAQERAGARQAHRVIADIYKAAHAQELPQATVASFVDAWLERRRGELAPASYTAYEGRGSDFVKWLGDAASRALAELDTGVFIRYRDHLAKRVSASTVNNGIKVLRVIFEDARRDGYIPENPAKDCGTLKRNADGRVRRPFTVDEIRRVLAVCDDEWRSIVLFALYTGQRLGDLARLSWANFDTEANEIHLRTAKTGRVVRVPVCGPLQQHLARLPAGDDPGGAIHPRLAEIAAKNGATLSRQFGEILAAAGLAPSHSHSASKTGRGARRTQNPLTFHAFRHTAVSMMKNAGVSSAVVQDLVGHESAEISAHYTHIDSEAKRRALESLPDFS